MPAEIQHDDTPVQFYREVGTASPTHVEEAGLVSPDELLAGQSAVATTNGNDAHSCLESADVVGAIVSVSARTNRNLGTSACMGTGATKSNTRGRDGGDAKRAHGTTARLTGSRCQCEACGQLFNAVSVFDRHRVGGWDDHGRNRRCLAGAEMLAKGWRMNTKGFWIRRFGLHLTRRSGDRALPGTLERA